MGMRHHAYLLDDAGFEAALRPVLLRALSDGGTGELVAFIRQHRAELTDPYEGQPLGEDWEAQVEVRDSHQYGDFALTRYYRVAEDRGVGEQWRFVAEVLQHVVGTEVMLLGTPLGPRANVFNPGKLGAYFQTPAEAARNLLLLKAAIRKTPSAEEPLAPLLSLLKEAVAARKGLYITF